MDVIWSDWVDLTIENVKAVPDSAVYAVYETRLVDCRGCPIALRRTRGIDSEAIFYIGASGEFSSCGPLLKKRLTKHRCAHANGKRGGASDQDLNVLWKKIIAKHGQGAWLQYRYSVLGSRQEALGIENWLQDKHQAQYGEKHDLLWKDQSHPLFP